MNAFNSHSIAWNHNWTVLVFLSSLPHFRNDISFFFPSGSNMTKMCVWHMVYYLLVHSNQMRPYLTNLHNLELLKVFLKFWPFSILNQFLHKIEGWYFNLLSILPTKFKLSKWMTERYRLYKKFIDSKPPQKSFLSLTPLQIYLNRRKMYNIDISLFYFLI